MSDNNQQYTLRISMNVLNHLGLNLYSNNAAVISEVVANAWDADATEVNIDYSEEGGNPVVRISDNGVGMDSKDIQEKYLLVGYTKRVKRDSEQVLKTPMGRAPMGRKGIGKLSMFSIANRISVYTKKKDNEGEAFMLEADAIKRHIGGETSSSGQEDKNYAVPPLPFNNETEQGTVIKIEGFKRGLNKNTFNGLKQRIARRFSIIGEEHNFSVSLGGEKIILADRGYFKKARFLFYYGEDSSALFDGLDQNQGQKMSFFRKCEFNEEGEEAQGGEYKIRGWVAIARNSGELNGKLTDENLNKITLVVRGKVAQEDILHDYHIGGIISKYIYGEIEADFLDDDDQEDIATSSRQRIIENDPRYIAFTKFMKKELDFIWKETNRLKDKKGMEEAIGISPALKEWYDALTHQELKEKAEKIFGLIDRAGIDAELRKKFYAYGVLAFERERLTNSAKLLEHMDETNVQEVLSLFGSIDDVEAALYREIVGGRLNIIRELQKRVKANVLEKELQNFLFEHLWLFDPTWDRAVGYADMERRIQSAIDEDVRGRTDIEYVQYRRMHKEHVIIELKRPNVSVTRADITAQLYDKYMRIVRDQLKVQGEDNPIIIGICVLGNFPQGWSDVGRKKEEEKMLKAGGIQVTTYAELVANSERIYSKYAAAQDTANSIIETIKKIEEGG